MSNTHSPTDEDKTFSGYLEIDLRIGDDVIYMYQTRETVLHQPDIQTFEVFGQPMKHCLECLIYPLNRTKN